MDNSPLLDLFCGAGGAGEGYALAGFAVVGVDLDPRPLRHNPHECYQGDALAVLDTLLAGETWQGYRLDDFAAIHASPPCQDYCSLKALHPHKSYPRLIEPVRERLLASRLPWVLENIMTAPLHSGVMLCGGMFGLRTYRHRRFETATLMFQPMHPRHTVRAYAHRVNGISRKEWFEQGGFASVTGDIGSYCGPLTMGIDWMTGKELSQAIPPAYTEWLGRQLRAVVESATAGDEREVTTQARQA